MAKLEAKIAVEKVVHDVLKETIQKISDEYGIQITSLDIDWFETIGGDCTISLFREESFSR